MTIAVAQFQLFFLALTRVLAVIIQVPVLGGSLVPNQVKLALGVILALVLLPWQPLAPDADSLPWMGFTFQVGRELLIGTLAGFAARATFGAMQVAGEVMGIGTGFASAQIINPTFGESGSTVDQLFLMTAMLLYLILDGHHQMLLALGGTFAALPLLAPLPPLSAEPLMRITAQLITAGVQIALPVMGALLLADLALALLSRVAPQVNPFFLGLPLKVGIGILAIVLALGVLFPVMGDLFQLMGPRMLQLIGA